MKLVTAKAELIFPRSFDDAKKIVEVAARTCYKSEELMTDESASEMVRRLIRSKHFAMLEHASATVRFIVDRGITHEIVRHRLASYGQESTRYCDYSKDKFDKRVSVIDIRNGMDIDPKMAKLSAAEMALIFDEWMNAASDSERHYMRMLELGASPQIARSVLMTSTKSELIATMNLREWRHFVDLRYEGSTGIPHPQMIEVTIPLFRQFKAAFPDFFFDMEEKVW